MKTGTLINNLFQAVERGSLNELMTLVGSGLSVNEKGPNNVTPLHLAADNGNLEMLKWLLDHGAEVNARTKSQAGYPGAETPLCLACRAGEFEAAGLLLSYGADPNLRSSDGSSPVEAAAVAGNAALVELLIDKGSNINLKGDSSALFAALAHRQLDIAQLLIDRGARNDVKLPPHSGNLLMRMAGTKWLPGVDLLLKNNVDVGEVDKSGSSALHYAVLAFATRKTAWSSVGKPEMSEPGDQPEDALPVVRRLLEVGADPDLKNNDGMSPRDYAKKLRAAPLVQLFDETQ